MFRFLKRKQPFSSDVYWENRYLNGGHSGAGSYHKLAEFKAEILNAAIREYSIQSVTEFGCGDGNQLSLLNIKSYIGLDVSETVIKNCIRKFNSDRSKSFFIYRSGSFSDNRHVFSSDATFSLDVLFHLVDPVIFENYIADLFGSAKRLVIIYAADIDHAVRTDHELYRKFTGYIQEKFPYWKLEKTIKNRFPSRSFEDPEGSLSNFFFYTREK